MRTLEFFYDAISPYSYLAWTQLPKLAEEFQLTVDCQPVLLAGILNHLGGKGPAEIPQKRAYMVKDILRWSDRLKVPLEGPPSHPFNPLPALRCAMALKNREVRMRYSGFLLEAVWEKGEDATDRAVLKRLLLKSAADPDEVLKASETDVVKNALKDNTANAIGKGVFGVPAMIVDGELFWGNDRLDFLREFLSGKDRLDRQKFERVLARPASSTR